MRNNGVLTYILFAIVGLLLAYNTSFSAIEEAKAGPIRPLDLPTLEFNPKGSLSLEIDLSKGISHVQSDLPIANVDVTVNHPAKVEVKNPVKKEVIYDTKTEYLVKVVSIPLQIPAFTKPSIKYPNRVVQ